MTFGETLRVLRGDRKRTHIADGALDPKVATPKRRRDFANYLRRIELDQVPNLGLGSIRQIARGFGYATLGEFFGALDAISLGRRPPSVVEVAHGFVDLSPDAALSGLSLTIS